MTVSANIIVDSLTLPRTATLAVSWTCAPLIEAVPGVKGVSPQITGDRVCDARRAGCTGRHHGGGGRA
ncbi:hypothetical protein Z949_1097 [Sulfitobacter guttiformis KCTC 32187]|nr:hypothetical protein Z949_1097 [Sulfitobacter guttiformis KCTC 32187]